MLFRDNCARGRMRPIISSHRISAILSYSGALALYRLHHWFYETKISVFPSVYDVDVSAAVICKNKEVLVKQFHLHRSLIRTHWFEFKLFIFYDSSRLLYRENLRLNTARFSFALSMGNKFFLVFLYLSFKLFYYLIDRRVYLAGNSFCLYKDTIDFE